MKSSKRKTRSDKFPLTLHASPENGSVDRLAHRHCGLYLLSEIAS